MIAHLTGRILYKQPNLIVIDVGGVGYEVTIPLSTFYGLGDVGADISLRIHTSVREDAIQLFGFLTAMEKELFLRLISVSGIGPRLAIAMLSGMPVPELVPAIVNNDLGRLTSIPGVGRKTAERVVVELRDKLKTLSFDEAFAAPAGEPVSADVREDTIAALQALGYPKPVAEKAVAQALREEGPATIEAVLKRALRRLSK